MNDAGLAELRHLLSNCLRQDRLHLETKLARMVNPRHLKPGRDQFEILINEAVKAVAVRHRRHERLPQVSYPSHLPITARKDEIVAAIKAYQVVVIAGETGSGKTTQIPKMCLEAGLGVEGKIGCTQPRRVAALSISRRIAEELAVDWGQEVGCKIRFSDRSSPLTYIKLMTDGILLAETQGDPDLNEYDLIVIDEAHERSLNIDFLLGHLKLLLARRADLKLVITSATIDTEAFSRAFGNAPILEVSGRTFPVEIRYAPHDPDAEESGDLTYIDAAVNAVETALLESDRGDVLIFMPSERDIRETQDDLQGRYRSEAEIIPLFGRLTAGEQDRVFALSNRRKIIVATNIAETSLTIPGVRYVIDTGLARMSRYSPRTRTKRLPIEPISQSSAKQRAGRSGRVENGVCIRLYAEEDFAARLKDTQPEIQRANLAEVILKMKAWRLGEMETFPFINPPQPQAVNAGYQLLQELGALNESRNLTDLGRDLARLPVDPSIGRMILQSVREGALEEVLVVAAGLSIQDPRERPLDRQEAADHAHRQFLDPHSDFLTLLNIWNAYDAKLEALRTQNLMRKFCKANYLSFTRMREWIDIHAQLREAVEGLRSESNTDRASVVARRTTQGAKPEGQGTLHPQRRHPRQEERGHPMLTERYAAIHRSILAGLLGHVAQRIERNLYRASANRQVMLWPGSSLFERQGKGANSRKESPTRDRESTSAKPSQPAWIIAGEMIETSRLFARTVAGVSPEWIVQLGEHICKRSYGAPFWDARTGRVLARERVTLFGLEVYERAVDYGKVNSKEATELFIRWALVEGEMESPHRFIEHNRQLRQKIEVWRTHSRDHKVPNPEEALFDFYARHLENVSSFHDLNRLVRERGKGAPDFLCASETDFAGGQSLPWDATAFPSAVRLDDQSAPLEYAYAPGQEHDGITVKLPAALAQRLDAAVLDWLVPGLRKEQIEFLLKALPKALRIQLMPIPPKVAELVDSLDPDAGLDGLRQLVRDRYGVAIPPDAWTRELLPDHLRPRIAVTGKNAKVIAAGRDLNALRQNLEKHETPAEQQAWARAVLQCERYDLRQWNFGDLAEVIDVGEVAGTLLRAFPGLITEESGQVHLKLFRNRAEAEVASKAGFARLAENALGKELAWAQKDLRSLEKLKDLWAGPGAIEALIASAYRNLCQYLIKHPEPLLPLQQERFEATVTSAKCRLPGTVSKLIERVTVILRARQEILKHRAFTPSPAAPRPAVITDLRQLGSTPGQSAPNNLGYLRAELDWLVPRDFLVKIAFDRLEHWPRYLKALQVRADRALLNPLKDQERAKQVRPYVDALAKLNERKDLSPAAHALLDEFRWLVEEFKVSVFAQELGTAQPVSPKRLDALLQTI